MTKANDDLKDPDDDGSDDTDHKSGDRNDDDDDQLTPAEKIGERPDNLRRRSDWFQKRTGKR